MPVRYEDDFYSWTQEQAAFLKAGRLDLLDLAHLADEVADMGKSEIRAFASRLALIIAHLLKLQMQTDRTPKNDRSWRTTVGTRRDQLAVHLADNPGLKNPAILDKAMASAWKDGRLSAIMESGLDPLDVPDSCPFTLTQLLDRTWWP